jgi:BirA family transcriptional regulator, biotin operon repressor / biotin---[acetyl-CoA-carboxylase] ligase
VPETLPSASSDPSRAPLDGRSLAAALTTGSALWRSLEVVPEIGSTNAALLAAAAEDAPEGTVLAAEHQVTGRGRLDRVWTSPPGAGVTVSFLLRPDVPGARRGWLPLLTGVVLAEAVGEVPGVRASLKWPNDLLAAGVVGVGLNVSTRADELPDTATSLALEAGRPVDRAAVLLQFLRTFEHRYLAWAGALGDPVSSGLARDYLAWCSTVGAGVVVTLPDGSTLEGVAESVDWDGRLVVRTPQGTVELASGDVRHLRGRM